MKRHFAARAVIALALGLVAAGCGNRGGSLVGYQPEGNPKAAMMLVQVDSTGGGLGASAIVFMPAPANRIRLYDDVNLKGYVPTDALVEPTRTYTTTWAVYRTPIVPYDPNFSHALLARGSRDGHEGVLSPLSNVALIPAGGADLIAKRDTLPLFPRAPVVNADAAPSIHVDSLYFHIAGITDAQTIVLEVVKSRVTDYLTVFQRQSNGLFVRVLEFENIPPALGQTYFWHVDEYDGGSRLIGATTVNGSFVITAPKVSGAPFAWPSTSDHFVFFDWTIPGFVAQLHPAR